MQEWVSIYEPNECDIRTPDIYRFGQVDGLSTGPPDRGVTSVLLDDVQQSRTVK